MKLPFGREMETFDEWFYGDPKWEHTDDPELNVVNAARVAWDRAFQEGHRLGYDSGTGDERIDQVRKHRKVREDLECLCAQLNEGVRENEDGTYHMVWTQTELDVAKKRAEKLRDLLK